jgi:hypothetical protein
MSDEIFFEKLLRSGWHYFRQHLKAKYHRVNASATTKNSACFYPWNRVNELLILEG